MDFGSPTLCFKATDLARSREFYEALGMEVVEDVPGVRVVLGLGSFRLGLFPFLEEAWLNLRGADVSAVHGALKERSPALEGKLQRYKKGEHGADADGECWLTRDPAGNAIFFDTHADEREKPGEAETAATILALERAALDRWSRGDPSGFLEISAPDVVYFDPFRERRVDGLAELTRIYDELRGKVQIARYEIQGPQVQVAGDAAVLTFRFVSYGGNEDAFRWNCTEVYRRDPAGWRIIQTHWSFTNVGNRLAQGGGA